MDSGATNNMINKKYEEHLVNTMDVYFSISVAKRGDRLQAHKSGTLKLTSITIKDVLSYNLEFNLLSVKKIESHSFKVFDNTEIKSLNKNSEVVTGNLIGNLDMIKFQIYISTAVMIKWKKLISYKPEIPEKIEEYEAMVTAKFGTRISHIRCDNGGEQFIEFCKSEGIHIEYTITRNPELNGLSEHFNRTLLDLVRCMLLDSKAEKKFWAEAVCAATY
ncbi:hypothetical protein PR048_011898 [Dryococelus australis]|uniref:Uncharacterized protein n=1 Tax=Dryococelus australis TaxID=614101 RepID=A0ABQ9HND8_9NEOP|nr:hypothetical protein PR048_011898 [Dryococelus australis]